MEEFGERMPLPDPKRVLILSDEKREELLNLIETATKVLRDELPLENLMSIVGEEKHRIPEENYIRYQPKNLPNVSVIIYSRQFRYRPDSGIPWKVDIKISQAGKSYAEGLGRQLFIERLDLTAEKERNPIGLQSIGISTAGDYGDKTSFMYESYPQTEVAGQGYSISAYLVYAMAGAHPLMFYQQEKPEHTRFFKSITLARFIQGPERGEIPKASTGEVCPYTGAWATERHPDAPIFIKEGTLMPYDNGMRATWTRKDSGLVWHE